MKKIILLLIACAPVLIYAQAKQGQAKIDSLVHELPKAKEDTNKVNLLRAIGYFYSQINQNEGIKYGQECLNLAKKIDWKLGTYRGNYIIGLNYFTQSDINNAKKYFFEALKTVEAIENKAGIRRCFFILGNCYSLQSDYPKSLDYYEKALQIDEEIGDKIGMAECYGNMGLIYSNQGDYPKSLEYHMRSLKIDEALDRKSDQALDIMNIGSIYVSQNELPKALEYYQNALKINEAIDDKNGIASCLGNIASIYYSQRDLSRSLEYYQKTLKLFETLGNRISIATTLRLIGNIHTLQNKYAEAMVYHLKALKLFEEAGDKYNFAQCLSNIACIYVNLANETAKTKEPDKIFHLSWAEKMHRGKLYEDSAFSIYKRTGVVSSIIAESDNMIEIDSILGDFKSALAVHRQYTFLKDSIYSTESKQKIFKLETKRALELKDKQIEIDKLAVAKKHNERLYFGIGIAALMVVIFFIAKERKKSETLLLNILPAEVAAELKSTGGSLAKHFDDVTVILTDFVDFTNAGERMSPQQLVNELDTCFKAFDAIIGKYHIEKIKTIGDGYLAVSGLPKANPQHALNIVKAAAEIRDFMLERKSQLGDATFEIRIGVHSGSVVAGIVGIKKFAYDIWGDTVNTASRMEQNCEAGKVNISQTTYELVKDNFTCNYRGEIEAKNKGMLKMYYVG